jgi:OPA family glycerol-3-phosphate transporter-like MFS transporter
LTALGIGYIGVYLCRKNLAVAVPLLQSAFGATKEEVGTIASAGTLAYAIGKLVNGLVVDRIGGRRGFLLSLVAVAVSGAAGALAPGLLGLMLFYSLNRYAGSAAWNAMVKLVPSWFGVARTATAVGALSVSYVAGGVAATLLARQVIAYGGGWRAVMGVPSIVLLTISVLCAAFVRVGPVAAAPSRDDGPASAIAQEPPMRAALWALLRRPQFLVCCGLSLTVTLMRESFNTWNVDFLTSIQIGQKSVATAALHSIGFDMSGAIAILATGLAYDRVAAANRRWLMAGTLALLAIVLAILPRTAAHPPWGAILVGVAGLLVYGPFSLLSGVLAIESGGARLAATAAGCIDGVGYLAAILAGAALGRLLDIGGYSLGFEVLAIITAASAVLALALPSRSHDVASGLPV